MKNEILNFMEHEKSFWNQINFILGFELKSVNFYVNIPRKISQQYFSLKKFSYDHS